MEVIGCNKYMLCVVQHMRVLRKACTVPYLYFEIDDVSPSLSLHHNNWYNLS